MFSSMPHVRTSRLRKWAPLVGFTRPVNRFRADPAAGPERKRAGRGPPPGSLEAGSRRKRGGR